MRGGRLGRGGARGELQRVIVMWNVFIRRNPDEARAYVERGGAYFQLGDLDAAERDARRACDLGHSPGCDRLRLVEVARARGGR